VCKKVRKKQNGTTKYKKKGKDDSSAKNINKDAARQIGDSHQQQ